MIPTESELSASSVSKVRGLDQILETSDTHASAAASSEVLKSTVSDSLELMSDSIVRVRGNGSESVLELLVGVSLLFMSIVSPFESLLTL